VLRASRRRRARILDDRSARPSNAERAFPITPALGAGSRVSSQSPPTFALRLAAFRIIKPNPMNTTARAADIAGFPSPKLKKRGKNASRTDAIANRPPAKKYSVGRARTLTGRSVARTGSRGQMAEKARSTIAIRGPRRNNGTRSDRVRETTSHVVKLSVGSRTRAAWPTPLRTYLRRTCQSSSTKPSRREQHVDWPSSWRPQQVGAAEWEELKGRVRREYAALIETLESLQTWDEQQVGDGMAIVAHTAYHLGAIRHAVKNLGRSVRPRFTTDS
jgi:hypothetical protein